MQHDFEDCVLQKQVYHLTGQTLAMRTMEK